MRIPKCPHFKDVQPDDFTLCHASIILPLGITLIFVEKGTDPLGLERIKTNAHSLIGLISSILAFIQPFMAFIRPSPESHKRWLFNASHFLVGTTAFFLVIPFTNLSNWIVSPC